MINEEILGMDRDVAPAPPAPAANLRHRESLTYAYTYSAWSECSAPCNGGTQHRSVQCMVQDSTAPHVVDDSYCDSQGLPRPASQQACNQQQCAEYSVSSYSVVGTGYWVATVWWVLGSYSVVGTGYWVPTE